MGPTKLGTPEFSVSDNFVPYKISPESKDVPVHQGIRIRFMAIPYPFKDFKVLFSSVTKLIHLYVGFFT